MDRFEADKQIELVGLILKGSELRKPARRQLEDRLREDPDDLSARVLLIGYCFTRHHFCAPLKRRRRQHILWLIEHLPENPFSSDPFVIIIRSQDHIGYRDFRATWLKQVEKYPDNVHILANAAAALRFSELALAQEIAQRAVKCDRNDEHLQKVLDQLAFTEALRTNRSMAPSSRT